MKVIERNNWKKEMEADIKRLKRERCFYMLVFEIFCMLLTPFLCVFIFQIPMSYIDVKSAAILFISILGTSIFLLMYYREIDKEAIKQEYELAAMIDSGYEHPILKDINEDEQAEIVFSKKNGERRSVYVACEFIPNIKEKVLNIRENKILIPIFSTGQYVR